MRSSAASFSPFPHRSQRGMSHKYGALFSDSGCLIFLSTHADDAAIEHALDRTLFNGARAQLTSDLGRRGRHAAIDASHVARGGSNAGIRVPAEVRCGLRHLLQ